MVFHEGSLLLKIVALYTLSIQPTFTVTAFFVLAFEFKKNQIFVLLPKLYQFIIIIVLPLFSSGLHLFPRKLKYDKL